MMTGKEKSKQRREKATEAINALGVPGVSSTRNLEAWLIEKHRIGVRVAMYYVNADGKIFSVTPQDVARAAAPAPEAGEGERE